MHRKEAIKANSIAWLIFAILIMLFDLFWLIVPMVMVGFGIISWDVCWGIGIVVCGFVWYVLWEGYTLSKKKVVEEER